MAETRNKALELAMSFLKEASKNHEIRSAYLYGSYAKDGQKGYSDIDLCLVIPKTTERYYEESFEIFHQAQEFNSLIETICFREDEFNRDGESLVAKIKKEGVEIKFKEM